MTRRGLIVACAPLLVAGCASGPETVREVRVPVPVACLAAMPEKPAFPADDLDPAADLWTKGTTLWADRAARQAYEKTIETTLRACVASAP